VESIGNKVASPPGADELEVSIFGPGFGECILLHVGGGRWGVVDSCLDPESKQPAGVRYLDVVGIDLSAVRFVVATHWHDDHMHGIAELFQKSKSAVFSCTEAVCKAEFSEVLIAWGENKLLPGGSGVDELRRIFEEVRKRQDGTRYPAPRLASANKIIWEDRNDSPARLKALSPSDAAVLAAMARLREIAPRHTRVRRRLPDLKPNDTSVVLSVEAGEQRVLLGADLQVRADRGLGWLAVVDGATERNSEHEGFRVSHHGSPNADHPEIWGRMLQPKAWAVTTPFVSGNIRLPSPEDCRRILEHSGCSYLTAPPKPTKFRDPDRAVERTVAETTKTAHFIPGKYGHVRLRKDLNGPADDPWRVEMFGSALSIKDYLAT
jgi:hypothetical protein